MTSPYDQDVQETTEVVDPHQELHPPCSVCGLQIFGRFYNRLGTVGGVHHFAHRNCAATAAGRGLIRKLREEEQARIEEQARKTVIPPPNPPTPMDDLEDVPVVTETPKQEHWLAPNPYGDDDED